MELKNKLSDKTNLQSIVHDYFEELMALNSIIYNTDLSEIIMKENNNILTTYIEFKSERDCDIIYQLTKSNYTIRYGQKINIYSTIISPVRLCIVSTKD